MALTINSPVAALRNMRSLRETQGTISDSLRRISTGVRVDVAADDPGRLGSTLLAEAKLRGLRQSIRNLNDGLSLTQTLEGGLSQITNALQRLRELSVQAGNETYNAADRQALQAEAEQMIDLIDKAVEQTKFNGLTLMDGTAKDLNIFIDQPSGEVNALKLDLLKVDTHEMSRQAHYESERRGVYLGTLANGDLKINGVEIRGTVESDDTTSLSYKAGSAIAKAKAINSAAHLTGVTARVSANVITANRAIGPYTLDAQNHFSINGVGFSGFLIQDFDADGTLRDAINSAHQETGVKAQLDSKGQLQLIAEDGRNIQIKYSNMLTMLSIGLADTSGDEINLKGIVEKSTIEQGNPASNPSFTPAGPTSADYFGTIMNVVKAYDANNSFNINDFEVGGSFDPGVENIDYVVQFIKAGNLGTAQFRIISETASETNSAEALELGSGPDGEDFSFLVQHPPYATDTSGTDDYFDPVSGAITNTATAINNMVVAGTYNEGADRLYTLTVVSAGSTDGPEAHARIEVTTNVDVDNLGNPIVIAAFTVQSGVAHNIGAALNQTGENLTVTFGDTLRGQSVSQLTSGQEYNLTLQQGSSTTNADLHIVGDFDDYDADVTMTKTIQVVETGYTSQAGNLAKLRVINNIDGVISVAAATFTITANSIMNIGDGLGIYFPDVDPVLEFQQNAVIPRELGGTGSYEVEQNVTLASTIANFVGERGDGTYTIEIVNGGRTGLATYKAYYTNSATSAVTSFTLSATLNDGVIEIADGIELNFQASSPTLSATSNSIGVITAGDTYGDNSGAYDSTKFYFSGPYTGEYHDATVSVVVETEGRVLNGAEGVDDDAAVLRYTLTPGLGLAPITGTTLARTGSFNIAGGISFNLATASDVTTIQNTSNVAQAGGVLSVAGSTLGYAGSVQINFDETQFEYGKDLNIRIKDSGNATVGDTGGVPTATGTVTVELVDAGNTVVASSIFAVNSGVSNEVVKGLNITFTNDFTAVSLTPQATGATDLITTFSVTGSDYNNVFGDAQFDFTFKNVTSENLTSAVGANGALEAGTGALAAGSDYTGNYGSQDLKMTFQGTEIVPSTTPTGSGVSFSDNYNGTNGDSTFDLVFKASAAGITSPGSPTTGAFVLDSVSGYRGFAGFKDLDVTFEGVSTSSLTASTVTGYSLTTDVTGYTWNGSVTAFTITITDDTTNEFNVVSGGVSQGTYTSGNAITRGTFTNVIVTLTDTALDTTGDEFSITVTPLQTVKVSDGANDLTGIDISSGTVDMTAASFTAKFGDLSGLNAVQFTAATSSTADVYTINLTPDTAQLQGTSNTAVFNISSVGNTDFTIDLATHATTLFGAGASDPGFDLTISNPNGATDETITYQLNTKTSILLEGVTGNTLSKSVSGGAFSLDTNLSADERTLLLGTKIHPTDTTTGIAINFSNVDVLVDDTFTLELRKTPTLDVERVGSGSVSTFDLSNGALYSSGTVSNGVLDLSALLGADPGFNINIVDGRNGFDDNFHLDLVSSSLGIAGAGEVVGNLNVRSLQVGDTFNATLTADVLNSGDKYSVDAITPVLRAGSSYTVNEFVNRFELGDTMTVDVDSTFNSTVYTAQSSVTITNGLTLEFDASSAFDVGDEIRFQASGYRGGFSVFGQYTDPAYPTTIMVEVIQEGEIDGGPTGARLRATRLDGGPIDDNDDTATFVEFDAVTTAQTLSVGGDGYIGQGVFIQFDKNADTNAAHRLYKGDVFYIDVIGSLSQNFASKVVLESDENILLEYSDANVDNKLGRLLYVGDPDLANNPGTIGSLSKAVLAVNTEFSIAKLDLTSQEGAEDALVMIDHAIARIDQSRIKMGALQNRMSSEISALSEAAFQTERYGSRIKDADMANEVAQLSSAQIRQQAGIDILRQINESGSLSLMLVESLIR